MIPAPSMEETLVPLTLEEHRHLARELRQSRVHLRELCNLVASVYGPNAAASLAFEKAAESVDLLCVEMQRQVVRDCPTFSVDGLYR
jgi:hypothetical protein